MKKRNVIFTGFLLVGIMPVAGQTGFTLRGSFSGMPDSLKVTVTNTEQEGNEKKLAEGFTSGGAFTLQGHTRYPALCTLKVMRYREKAACFVEEVSVRLMVENGETMVASALPYDSLSRVEYSFDQEKLVKVTGSKAQTGWEQLRKETYETERKAILSGYLSTNKYFESKADRDTVAKYEGLKAADDAALRRIEARFAAQHPDYHISAYLMCKEMLRTFAYTTPEIERMAAIAVQCPDTARVNFVNRLRTWSLRYALAEPYKDFEACKPEGGTTRLSALRKPGTYLLLDFWASWCGPCRSAIPGVKEMYDHYNGKLEVISVSVDEKEPAWHKAVEEEKMPWPQLRLDKEQMNHTAPDYYITAIPRLVLIDADNRIVCVTNKPDAIKQVLEEQLK